MLFAGISVPQQAWKSCIFLLPTAATGAGQPGRARSRRQEAQRAGQPLLPCGALLGSPHTSAQLRQCCCWALCPSAPLLVPVRENLREEIGQSVAPHHCNRHNTCYCACDPIKITLTLMFWCTPVEKRAQLAPFPLSLCSSENFLQQDESPSQRSAPATSAAGPPTALLPLLASSWDTGIRWLWSHAAQGSRNLAIPCSAPRSLALGCGVLPTCNTNPTGCPVREG